MRQRAVLIIQAKTVSLLLLIVALASVAWSWPQVRRVMVPLTEIVSGKIVYIDPGHGGRDPGCVSADGLAEKDLVLDIAKQLRNLFLRSAIDARLIRQEDTEVLPPDWAGGRWKRPELNHRVHLANEGKGNVFISIHANSFPEPVWSGAQTFYYPGREDDKSLAISIQNMLVTNLGPNQRKAKPGEFFVLGGVNMPAAMVEVGFLSNPREAGLLATSEYRGKVAEAIFEGVIQYLVESRTRRNVPLGDGVEKETAGGSELIHQIDELVLYFPGPTNQDDCLVPELRSAPELAQKDDLSPEDVIKIALKELISGPGSGSILYPLLPPTTTIQEVIVSSEGKITVDLGPELEMAFQGGGHSEELIIYGIVNTIADLFPSSGICLRLNGESEASIGGHLWLNRELRKRSDLICPK